MSSTEKASRVVGVVLGEGRGGHLFALSTKSTFAVDTCTFGEGKSVEEQHEVVKQIEGHGMKKSPGS